MFAIEFNRHSPDDSRTGVNSSDFLASLEARRELPAATRTTGGTLAYNLGKTIRNAFISRQN
jgi:hypothetical protein